jgi:hypothetical protein
MRIQGYRTQNNNCDPWKQLDALYRKPTASESSHRSLPSHEVGNVTGNRI